jgi:hypothetical protein
MVCLKLTCSKIKKATKRKKIQNGINKTL